MKKNKMKERIMCLVLAVMLYQRYHTYGTGIKDGGSIIISGG